MPLLDIGAFVLSRFPKPQEGWTLAMDRTNWKFGETHINILAVGVVIKGIAIPIVWTVLPPKNKRGNSHTGQRIDIIIDVLKLMPADSIYVLTMDREFIGKKWLRWLNDEGVDFVVRIKKNSIVNGLAAHKFRLSRKRKGHKLVDIWGLQLYFGAKSIQRGRDSHLYVISNKFQSKQALKIYKQRWAIELLFSHLKKRGFNLEDTHLREAAKIERLFGVLTLSFLVTYSWGLMLSSSTKLTVAEKRKSAFRLGLESLMEIFNTNQIITKSMCNIKLDPHDDLPLQAITVSSS